MREIKRALISVYHKDGLDKIIKELHKNDVEIISTGGTYDYIESLSIPVKSVESLTGYPSILGGRVKTLHPAIFGGILSRRDNEEDIRQAEEYNIGDIDLVIVDLYPFEEYVEKEASHDEIIEKIDIGGISLIRAAAKNYKDVVVVPSQKVYDNLINVLVKNNGATTLEEREWFASYAFSVTSHYDSAIFEYLSHGKVALRYGENPHQNAYFCGPRSSLPQQLHGKDISYNNLLDIEAAIELIHDFNEPAVAIIKHNNACGCAVRGDIKEAWIMALAADPVSAFGGIIAANREIDKNSALEITKIFFEVIIAPSYSDEALEILKEKKNRIILLNNNEFIQPSLIKSRSLLGGTLVQERDNITETSDSLKTVTQKEPAKEEIADLIFANILVKHSKSNAIVLAKNRSLIASGIGQTSRVDALKQAIEKAKGFNNSLNGAVMASDAFFPFPDCVEIAHNAGIVSVIQPGGSVKDRESIDYCDKHNMSMVVTGFRHFKH